MTDTSEMNIEYVFAAAEDLPEVTAMWKESFGDDESYISEYYASRFTPERILLAKSDGVTASMTSVFPVEYGDLKAIYIYALATKPEFRGRGLAKKLLLRLREMYGRTLLLQPEPTGVDAFYRSMGFETMDAETFWQICKANGITDLTLGVVDALVLR